MSAPSTIGDASHADKLAEIHRLRDVNTALLASLESVTLLFRTALLCTTVEIAREAKPFLEKADAAIARAKGETFTTGHARHGVAP